MIDINEKVSYKEFFEKQKEVISWLEDNLSKRIFAVKSGVYAGLTDYVISLYAKGCVQLKCKDDKIIENILEDSIKSNSDNSSQAVILYGYNVFSEILYRNLFQKLKHKKALICDKNAKELEIVSDFPIITPEELISYYQNSKIIVAIRSDEGKSEVLDLLKSNGVNRDNIFFLEASGYSSVEQFNPTELKNNYIYMAYILDGGNQYFDEVIKLSDNEVFTDIGVLDGQTSLNFINHVNNKYKKIYLFEPDSKSYENTKVNLLNHNIENFELFPLGLSNKKETLSFYSDLGGSSRLRETGIVTDVLMEQGILSYIDVDTLDNILKDTKADDMPTFIKMDIEGFELNALKGAENIIKTYNPKLAISIYHKPEDLIELPAYIKSLVPEYKFYLRHYSYTFAETVLYAILP